MKNNNGHFAASCKDRLQAARKQRRTILAIVVEGLLTLLAVLFVCRAYGAETRLPVELERKISLIRADFESNRTTLALRKAAELSEQHKNDPQVHFALGVLLASHGEGRRPAARDLRDTVQSGTDLAGQR
jgi:hypothetical protein